MYNLSKNYEILWNLVNDGKTVVCFVNYDFRDGKEPCRDVCKCCKWDNDIMFGARGIQYGAANFKKEWKEGYEQKIEFLAECERMNVEFIDNPESIATIDSQRERILCAAVHVDDGKKYNEQPKNIHQGYVITGHRHKNCYATLAVLLGDHVAKGIQSHHTQKRAENMHDEAQGFLTSKNNYVTRREAWKIAKENGQIVFGLDTCEHGEDSILISENLY